MRAVLTAILAAGLVGCASVPTSKTVEVPSAVPASIAAELLKIGLVVAPPPTEKLYAPLAERLPYAGVQVRRDVRYGTDSRNLLDVFTPDKAQAHQPVLVFVHGGAFMRGERRTGDSPFYDNIMLWAVRQGMVGVNMTYRLAPAHPWPAAQQDIQSALKWVRENIAASGGNPQRIILMGHSAGAAHVAQYLGHPQFHVVPGLVAAKVPLLLAYAELDPPDFHRQSEQLNAALCQAGQCPGLYKLMGHSHMSEIYSINSADKTVGNLMKQLVDRVR